MKSSVQSWFSGSRPYFSRYFAHCVSCGHHGATNSALPSSCAIASQRMSMLPLSSTGIPSPPSSVPQAIGIGAQVVRRVGKFPVRARPRNRESGTSEALASVGLSRIQMRIHREEHVHRGDVAVAGVFLGEKQRLLVGVGGQAACGDALAIGERARSARTSPPPTLVRSAISSSSNSSQRVVKDG